MKDPSNDPELEQKLTESLQKLSQTPAAPPELTELAKLVIARRDLQARSRNRQFALFAVLSVCIVAVVLLCLFKSLPLFLALQAVPFAALWVMVRRSRRAGGTR